MKIGEFADKYNLSKDTVRYYIDNGMIIPEKIHNRYHFDESCEKSMDFILQFKKMKFTIEEIKHIMGYMRMLSKTGKSETEYLLSIIDNKINHVEKEKAEYETALEELGKMKTEFEKEIKEAKTKYSSYSIPIDILHMLSCPKCGKNLKLNNTSIENNKIENGDLYCECGYEAKIENGMIITEDADKKSYHKSYDEELTYKSLMDENDMEYLSFLVAPSYWIEKRVDLEKLTGKNILILRPIGNELLYKFFENVKNANIIVGDWQYYRMRGLKKSVEKTDIKTNSNIVFFAADYFNIPFGEEIFDYIFDISGLLNYIANYKKSPTKNLYNLLKNNGLFFSTMFIKDTQENIFIKEVKHLDNIFTKDFVKNEFSIFQMEESAIIQGADFKMEIDDFMKKKSRMNFYVYKGRKIAGDD